MRIFINVALTIFVMFYIFIVYPILNVLSALLGSLKIFEYCGTRLKGIILIVAQPQILKILLFLYIFLS